MISREIELQISENIDTKLAKLVDIACGYSSRVYFLTKDKKINAKSLMGMITMIMYTGETLVISADGEDENEAVDTIIAYMSRSA